MNTKKAPKPQYNFINPDTIQDQVEQTIKKYCDTYGIDIYNYNVRSNIKHTEVNNILRYCFNNLFKPDHNLYNNQGSLIDYDNISQLSIVTDTFINVCSFFNKALGLYSFSIFSGISYSTLKLWCASDNDLLNPKRLLLEKIQDYNTRSLVDHLKDAGPVGAVAVANNDTEAGLRWSANQAAQITQNTVYLIPSERTDRLRLDKSDG